MNATDKQLKRAFYAALMSLLNLTILPVIGFVVLLRLYKKATSNTFDQYHALLGIKLNVLAAIALILVSSLMLVVGGFNSPMSWIYMVSYFVTIHALFILIATWALVCASAGDKLRKP